MVKAKSLRWKGTKEELEEQEGRVDLILPVACFRKGSTLREAYAIYWMPMNKEFNRAIATRPTAPFHHLRGPTPAWVKELRKAAPSKPHSCKTYRRRGRINNIKPRNVRVKIVLDYPLNKKHSKIVTIRGDRPGEVFGKAADLYFDIYKKDAERGGGDHVCDTSPGSKLMNRDFGPLVWGHDLSDLVFETIKFKALKGDKRCVGEVSFGIGS